MLLPRKRNRTHRPILDVLETRTVLSVTYNFATVGSSLYLDFHGDDLNNQILLGRNSQGDVLFQNSTDIDEDGVYTEEEIETAGSVLAGDIAVAALLSGTTFSGVRVYAEGGDDEVIATGAALPVPSNSLLYSATILGGDGDDYLVGGQGSDILFGGDGNDYLEGAVGVDRMFGDDGDDELQADRRDVFTGGNGGTGYDQLYITGSLLPNATLSVINTDLEFINGSDLAESIDNTGFSDTSTLGRDYIDGVLVEVYGQGGNDTIISGPTFIGDSDIFLFEDLYGGAGIDTISYAFSDEGVYVDLANNIAFGGWANYDIIDGFENVTGSDFADTLLGSAVANVIIGGGGDDYIEGGAGNDTINAGNGNNTVYGGAGNDSITTGSGIDYIEGGDGNDTVNSGAGADEIYGNAGNDIVNAGDGADYVEGGAGNDTLNGDGGDDELHGGAGNDTIYGGAGVNQSYGEAGNDTILITWAEVNALAGLEPPAFGTNTGSSYFGNAGTDTFRIVLTPVGVSATTFQNVVSRYFILQTSLFGLSDYAFPDLFTRSATLS